MSAPDDLKKFIVKAKELLQMERKEEQAVAEAYRKKHTAKELEDKGVCLTRLKIVGTHSGLYGRCMVTFSLMSDKPLPSTTLRVRDVVQLCRITNRGVRLLAAGTMNEEKTTSRRDASGDSRSYDGKRDETRGIVYSRSRMNLIVAFDGDVASVFQEISGKSVSLIKLTNDVTYSRLTGVLQDIPRVWKEGSEITQKIMRIRFTKSVLPKFSDRVPPLRTGNFGVSTDSKKWMPPSEMKYVNPGLNKEQKKAVELSLQTDSVMLIHGPPGTGKTTTVVECIYQAVNRGEQVLACAASNIAVDNLCERLRGLKVVRVGHPARMLPSIIKFSLDSVVRKSEGAEVTRAMREDLEKKYLAISKSKKPGKKKSNNLGGADRKRLWLEAKELRKDLRKEERKVVSRSIDSAQVVLCTNSGSAGREIKDMKFDCIVVDEAAQALEASTWIPLLKGGRVILSGDHKQLPPVVTSEDANKKGLGRTLFEELMEKFEEKKSPAAHMLTTQYRMNETICTWSSREMYGGRLVAAPKVSKRLLMDLEHVKETDETREPMVLIDTAGCGFQEDRTADGESRSNADEATLVQLYVKKLLDAGLRPGEIGVVTPYNAQVTLVREVLGEKLADIEVGTVDGFQGREKECIIISMVRSNENRKVGFLAENRRMNVAVTRAKRHVVIIADSTTVGSDKFLKRLLEYCEECADYRSAEQEMEGIDTDAHVSETFPAVGKSDMLKDRKIKASEVKHEKVQVESVPVSKRVVDEKVTEPAQESKTLSKDKKIVGELIKVPKTASAEILGENSLASTRTKLQEQNTLKGNVLKIDEKKTAIVRTICIRTIQGLNFTLGISDDETNASLKEKALIKLGAKLPCPKAKLLKRSKELKDKDSVPMLQTPSSFLVLYIPRTHLPATPEEKISSNKTVNAPETKEVKEKEKYVFDEKKIEKMLLDFLAKSRRIPARLLPKKRRKKRSKAVSREHASSSSHSLSQQRLELDPSLSSTERKRVHEIIERLRLPLMHFSEGIPPNRRLVVVPGRSSRPSSIIEKTSMSKPAALMETAGRRMNSGDSKKSIASKEKNVYRPRKDYMKKSKDDKDEKKEDNELDFETILDDVQRELRVGKCGKRGCTVKMNAFTSFTCRFCRKIYCSKHQNPALHGCAVDARKAHLATTKGMRYKAPALTEARRNRLQAKLSKKIETKAASRTKKPNEKQGKSSGEYRFGGGISSSSSRTRSYGRGRGRKGRGRGRGRGSSS